MVEAHDTFPVRNHHRWRCRDAEVVEVAFAQRLRHPLQERILLLPWAFHVSELFAFGDLLLTRTREAEEFRQPDDSKALVSKTLVKLDKGWFLTFRTAAPMGPKVVDCDLAIDIHLRAVVNIAVRI